MTNQNTIEPGATPVIVNYDEIKENDEDDEDDEDEDEDEEEEEEDEDEDEDESENSNDSSIMEMDSEDEDELPKNQKGGIKKIRMSNIDFDDFLSG